MSQEILKIRKPEVQMKRRRRVKPFSVPLLSQLQPTFFLKGVAAEHGQKRVVEMKAKGENEKKEMQDLNVRLAKLLEKLHNLKAENVRLKVKLDASVGFEYDKIKEVYEDQLVDWKERQAENDETLSEIQSKNESLEELVEDLNEQ